MGQRFSRYLKIIFPVIAIFAVCSVVFVFASGDERAIPEQVTGELTVMYADDFENRRSRVLYHLSDAKSGRVFNLHFAKEPREKLQTGSMITVLGTAEGQDLHIEEEGQENLRTIAPAAAPVNGEQRTIVIIADFLDKSVSCPVSTVQDLMFTDIDDKSIDDLYQETSLGQIWFTGDVVGPYTINHTSTGACDYMGWAQASDAEASADGVNMSQYNRKIYVLPRNSQCQWAGLGTVGGNPSRSWTLYCNMEDVYAHELGHNLGMHHSSSLGDEYGDTSDIMGYAGVGLRQINAPHQEQMGWRVPQQILTITQDGYYDIAPLEFDIFDSTSEQILKIQKSDASEYFYLSYRRPLGFDVNLSGNYIDQISVHTYRGSGPSRTIFHGALADGESFTDNENSVIVTQVSHTDQSATVLIELGSVSDCIPDAPAVSMSPASQSGRPGTPLSYTVAVTNRDGQDCGQSTFSLNHTVPPGWTGTVLPGTLTLPPGQTGSATLSVTSASDAADGSFVVSAHIADDSEPAHMASESAGYVVIAADSEPPTAPTGLSGSAKKKQINLSWNAATDNIGVTSYSIWRDGSQIGTSTGTGYVDRFVTKGATYTYWVHAHDAAGNESDESNAVTLTFTGGSFERKGNGKGRNK